MGHEKGGFQAFLTQPPLVIELFAMRFNGYPLRLCDRKKSLGARSSLWTLVDKIHIRLHSCSDSGSAVVVSNCYQLAWILAVSRVSSWGLTIAAVKMIWVSSDDKTGESEVIWERTFAMFLYLSANSNALLTCLLLWILWLSLARF